MKLLPASEAKKLSALYATDGNAGAIAATIPFTSSALKAIAENLEMLDIPLFLGEPGDHVPVLSTDGDTFIIEIHDSFNPWTTGGDPSFTYAELV